MLIAPVIAMSLVPNHLPGSSEVVARVHPATHGADMMSAPTGCAKQSFMSASSVRPAAVNAVDDLACRCEQAFVSVQQSLAQRGTCLPEEEVALLRQLPGQLVLQLLAGLDAPTVHSPGGLLRWKLGQPHVQAALRRPFGHLARPTGAGVSTQPSDGDSELASARALPATGDRDVTTPTARMLPVSDPEVQGARVAHAQPMSVHCPGCGCSVPAVPRQLSPPSNPFRTEAAMAFTSYWCEHECGASWMCTGVPRCFGTGMGLSVWLPRAQPVPGRPVGTTSSESGNVESALGTTAAISAKELEHSAWPHLFCCLCGGLFEHATCGPGVKDDKITVQWECCVCDQVLVGCMEGEGARCHVTAFWMEPAKQ